MAPLKNILRVVILLLLFTVNALAQKQTVDLMPLPKNYSLEEGSFVIRKDLIISVSGQYDDRIEKEATRFLRRLDEKTGLFFHQFQVEGKVPNATFEIFVERPGKLDLHEAEDYSLTVSPDKISLSATTDIGAIRGLETLLQLVQVEDQQYVFPAIQIEDEPRFTWRGLMMDVSRHYIPLEVIFRNMDAMAAVKLNTLHLHLSDDQGFRFETKAFPELIKEASEGNYYSREDLEEILAYAHQRGIRVIPEIDVPGHATAMLVAFPELGSKDTTYILEQHAGIFDPTLDPTNEEVYTFLETLFAEIAAVFPNPIFHIGGDENNGKHWDANPDIQAFKKKHKLKTNHEVQTHFNLRLQQMLNKLGKRMMGWEEIMTDELEKTAIIHSWRGDWEGIPPKTSLYNAARSGYETVLSNGYYLDLMQPASAHYAVDPISPDADLTAAEKERILGGEMCMWSELVVPETIDSRLWPRGAAIAERLWSPGEVNDVADMYRRLPIISHELEQLSLEHKTARAVILRKLAQGHDVEPLQTLVEVVEPMKGYTRNPGGTMYAMHSPFLLWADAARPDAPVAREFNEKVKAYVKRETNKDELLVILNKWKANHAKMLPIIQDSPVLVSIKDMSANFSALAETAIKTISYLEAEQIPKADWLKDSHALLETSKENGGRTELQILQGVKLLVDQLEETAK